jgi:predicted phage terminase large subunit-like protein
VQADRRAKDLHRSRATDGGSPLTGDRWFESISLQRTNKATELSDFSVRTTWGAKGKELFLLNVFRRRLEYPALKRAVREQQSLFDANVVLIEDKASGTQLIQELIADGCHGVTRYQPTTDTVMRLHAQTALIENGFVRIPEEAPWLAEYLHELTVFPKGKHDDQADSTAQFLDWYKKPGKDQGYIDWLREAAEAAERLRNPDKDRERHRVLVKGLPSCQCRPGRAGISRWPATGHSKCLPMMRNR